MANVILVEDNHLYAEDLADYLQEVGHTVRVAGTATDMWIAVAEAAPEVILLDLGLPDACGLTLIPRLLEQYPSVRILVLTARSADEARDDALRLGAHGFLTKPVKFMSLAAHLHHICEQALAA
jgi:DNA-binding response OmpR family regulator